MKVNLKRILIPLLIGAILLIGLILALYNLPKYILWQDELRMRKDYLDLCLSKCETEIVSCNNLCNTQHDQNKYFDQRRGGYQTKDTEGIFMSCRDSCIRTKTLCEKMCTTPPVIN